MNAGYGKRRINENRLYDVLVVLFPHVNIVRCARRMAAVRSPASGRYLEVDFWVEKFNLAFEYQEEYHYDPVVWYSNTHENVQHNDNAKQTALKYQGRTLIQVPFWWDGTVESLSATIVQRRPDLEPILADQFISSHPYNGKNEVLPIPDCPPEGDWQGKESWIPGIGGLMFIPLLKPVHISSVLFSEQSAHGWWMLEKYDGVRACWVQSSQKLYLTSGTLLTSLPEMCELWLCNAEIDLDCELWFGRGNFIESHRVLHKNANYLPNWSYLRFLVYDCPSPNTKKLPHEERCGMLTKNTVSSIPFVELVSQMKLAGKLKQLENVLYDNILPHQGAGIVFKLSGSPYAHGCCKPSLSLQIKAKRTLTGVVVQDGQKESQSAFLLELFSGTRVHVTIDSANSIVPEVGDIIDIVVNSNINEYPSIHGDVLRVHSTSDSNPNNHETLVSKLNGISHSATKALLHYLLQRETFDMSKVSRHRQYGYWTEDGSKNMKYFFDSFAKRNKLGDPANPQTWYLADQHALKNEATFLRHHYGGSISTALMDAYPNIGLEPDFLISKGNYFQEFLNRKMIFDWVALGAGFDPAGQDHKWHTLTRDDVLSYPGGPEVLDFYGGSMIMGLCDVYPQLPLQEGLFGQSRNYWHRNVKKQLSALT